MFEYKLSSSVRLSHKEKLQHKAWKNTKIPKESICQSEYTVGLSWLARSGYRGIDVTTGTMPRLLNRNSPAHRISYAMKSYETNNETTRSSRHTCIPMTHQMLIKRSQRILINYINNAFVLECFIVGNFCLSRRCAFSFEWFRSWSIDQTWWAGPRFCHIILRIACVSLRANRVFHGLLHHFILNGIRRP